MEREAGGDGEFTVVSAVAVCGDGHGELEITLPFLAQAGSSFHLVSKVAWKGLTYLGTVKQEARTLRIEGKEKSFLSLVRFGDSHISTPEGLDHIFLCWLWCLDWCMGSVLREG